MVAGIPECHQVSAAHRGCRMVAGAHMRPSHSGRSPHEESRGLVWKAPRSRWGRRCADEAGGVQMGRDQGTQNLLCARCVCEGWPCGLGQGHSDTAEVSRMNSPIDLNLLPSLLSTWQQRHTAGEILEAMVTELWQGVSERLSLNSIWHEEMLPCWSPAAAWEAWNLSSAPSCCEQPGEMGQVLQLPCTFDAWDASFWGTARGMAKDKAEGVQKPASPVSLFLFWFLLRHQPCICLSWFITSS